MGRRLEVLSLPVYCLPLFSSDLATVFPRSNFDSDMVTSTSMPDKEVDPQQVDEILSGFFPCSFSPRHWLNISSFSVTKLVHYFSHFFH
jgi:hypothetical protein